MQRHLKTPAPSPVPVVMLSVEEEAILQDEHNEAGGAVDAAAADADRVTEVAEVANDAVLVVSDVPQIGQVEQELVGAVGDMAVAGTDADPMEVINVPQAEEGKGGESLSAEGIASALKSIWDAIVTAIKNMWVDLKHWLTTYFSSLEQNKVHAEKLIDRLKNMKGYVPNLQNQSIKIKDIFGYDKSSWMFSKLGSTVSGELQAYQKMLVDTLVLQREGMSRVGHSLEDVYKNIDSQDVHKVSGSIDIIAKALDVYVERLQLHPDSKSKWRSKAAANLTLSVDNYEGAIGDARNSMETKLALMSKVRFSLSQFTDFTAEGELTVTNDVTPDILEDMLKERLETVESLLHYKNETFAALERQVDAVEKACEQMINRVKPEDQEAQRFAKRLLPLTTAYANWATQPAQKLLNQAARHNKFWLSLYEKVTNNFHKEAA